MPSLTRRQFTKLVMAALPAAGLAGSFSRLRAEAAPQAAPGTPKVDSRVNGVLIGLNAPYSFGNNAMSGQETLDRCVRLGISGLELRSQPVELLGAPLALVAAKGKSKKGGAGSAHAKLREWRASAPVERLAEFRKGYESAGLLIQVVKVDGIFDMSDAELDYMFPLAKALGAKAISTEISKSDDDLKRLGDFGVKHDLWVAYHGHTAVGPKDWLNAFALSPRNAANVDIGHFIAGNNYSPIPFIKEHHERITHVHIKDRKLHMGENTPFGQGDTPIVETLHTLRDNHYDIMAAIEFEYKVPEGSDTMTEIAKCVKYCRDALA